MSGSLERLQAEALELSLGERARLAQRLIESLDEDTAAVECAWEDEIRRRIEEHRAGKVAPVPAADVFARARRRPRESADSRATLTPPSL